VIPQLYVGPGARAAALSQAATDLAGSPDGHPDARLVVPDKGEVGIDRIRELILWARYGPVQAPRKVAVIGPAEKLTREAANALLKLLEELPPHLGAVLFAEALDQVLPTVRSRCALLWCSGAPAQIHDALREAGYAEDEIAFIASVLDDRVEEAAVFLAERRDPLREWQEADADGGALSLLDLTARFTDHAADPLRRRAFGRHLARALAQSATDEVIAAVERLAQAGGGTVAAFLGELARFLAVEARARPDLPEAVRVAWARKASLARGELDDNANPRLLAEVVALWPRNR
jgi:hypothetical protein